LGFDRSFKPYLLVETTYTVEKKMPRRTVFSSVVLFLFLVLVSGTVVSVSGWSNGGFSSDPYNPVYGTHDWIAQHALDWLPQTEKWFILNNLALYLYGTELPDNSGAPDGIGDTTRHHVYYYANGSLQEDDSAVRAQEEYGNASVYFRNGDFVNASKRLGVVTHYIADMAVFGHVMGAATVWGPEIHHSDYEDYVNARTGNYTDEFNTFLVFDGFLSNISAYDAALKLAYDTTFDVYGGLTCVWMDQNYNWSNPTFKNHAGEALNQAVNLVADVLHTFYLETLDSMHFIDVPFHYQDKDYYCGPAALEMVFDYYGEDINQSEIADVARTIGPPLYSTYTDELRRAAHFSNISTSMGNEMPENITGYTLRNLGYAASEAQGMNLTQLKSYISQDKPLILLMWYSGFHYSGHFRVVTGYNETHVFLHDPWNKPLWNGTYGGPSIAFNNTYFMDLWSYYGNWALYVSPWTVHVSAPEYTKPKTQFQVNFTTAYLAALPNALSSYPASQVNATISLPKNLSLTLGEVQKKKIGDVLEAGANARVSWMLTANSSGTYTIGLEVEGLVSGSVWPHGNYTAYNYEDRIGATVNFTVTLAEDGTPPVIEVPSRSPAGGVQPMQNVTVSVDIKDADSGVEKTILFYTVDNGTTWANVTMNFNVSSSLYEATIPGQPLGTWVRFKILAYDFMENNATKDGTEPYYAYQVVPEFQATLVLSVLMILTLLTILWVKRRYPQNEQRD
jgi:uncharacterized protein YvpB